MFTSDSYYGHEGKPMKDKACCTKSVKKKVKRHVNIYIGQAQFLYKQHGKTLLCEERVNLYFTTTFFSYYLRSINSITCS